MPTITSAASGDANVGATWVGGVAPGPGDDVVIAAHTINFTADATYLSLLFSVASSHITFSVATCTITATNGFSWSATITGAVVSTVLTIGKSLTLIGSWVTAGTFSLNTVASSTGGNLTLQTVGADPAAILIANSATGNTRILVNSWTAGTLTTIGRIDLQNWGASQTIVSMFGGTWNHQSVGMNYCGIGGGSLFAGTGTSVINWTGSVEASTTPSNIGIFNQISNTITNTIGTSGDTFVLKNRATGNNQFTALLNVGTATVTIQGGWSSRLGGMTLWQTSGTINYNNQTVVLDPLNYFTTSGNGGTLNVSGLKLTTSKGALLFSWGAHSIVSNVDTLFTCASPAAFFSVYYNTALESRFVILESDPPVLPAQQDVAAGESYGYAASPLVGTGVINDPAAIAAAMTASLDNISVNALKRFVTVDTGETELTAGSVVSFGGGDPAGVTELLTRIPDAVPGTEGGLPILSESLEVNAVLNAATQESIADTVLSRNVSNVEATAGEHTLATAILGMLEWEISGNDLIIKRTDGTTVHYTKTLSSATGTGDVITGLN